VGDLVLIPAISGDLVLVPAMSGERVILVLVPAVCQLNAIHH